MTINKKSEKFNLAASKNGYVVKRTLVVDGEEDVTIFDEVYKTPEQCKMKMEKELEGVYGEDWQMYHGDDLTTDDNGMPYYNFDMGEGDYEEMEVFCK